MSAFPMPLREPNRHELVAQNRPPNGLGRNRGRNKLALAIREIGTDHHGTDLPAGIAACERKDSGTIASFKVRWRQTDEYGIRRQRSRSFSQKEYRTLNRALEAAVGFLAETQQITAMGGIIAKADPASSMTFEDVFQEWITMHGPDLSAKYAKGMVRLWDREIATRAISQVRLDWFSGDPAVLVRFQDELGREVKPSKAREIMKLLRAVLFFGRARHPNAMTVDISGLVKLPKVKRSRLPYAPDAVGVERIIEAVLNRPARDDLLPLRDAALVAALSYTVASRPSEWLYSAALENLFPRSVELQRGDYQEVEDATGLKTGAHVALFFPNARDRVLAYLRAREERYGPQPPNSLVFQALGDEGPMWATPPGEDGPVPLAWTENAYNRWYKRVWKPAVEIAAQAPDAPVGLAQMTFYDCRHFAISMALHSTLVVTPHGMNLHPLSGWSGHDIQTLQRYYAHFIARYHGQPPIDMEEEGQRARLVVEENPFMPRQVPAAPQREEQRRHRARGAKQGRNARKRAAVARQAIGQGSR
jgi:integrase